MKMQANLHKNPRVAVALGSEALSIIGARNLPLHLSDIVKFKKPQGIFSFKPQNQRILIFCLSKLFNGKPLAEILTKELNYEVYVVSPEDAVCKNAASSLKFVKDLKPDLVILSVPDSYLPERSTYLDRYIRLFLELSIKIKDDFSTVFLSNDNFLNLNLDRDQVARIKQPVRMGKISDHEIPSLLEKLENYLVSFRNFDAFENFKGKNF